MGVLTQYENDINSGIDTDLINDINKIGSDPLDTTAQTLSGAINEHEDDISELSTKVGSDPLTTIAADLSGAVNELDDGVADLEDKVGSDTLDTQAQNLSGAVNELNTLIGSIVNVIYPVGSYYETTDTTFDPNVSFGGTWVLEAEGLVHVSGGSTYTVSNLDQDGGSSSITYTPAGTVGGHSLTVDQMPAHSHRVAWVTTNNGSNKSATYDGQPFVRSGLQESNTYQASSNSKGSGSAHSHGFTGTEATLDTMQPYKVVNRWHRTA